MAFSRFIAGAAGGGVVEIYGDGEQRRDFTFVGDAVDATLAAAEAGEAGSAYNVSGGAEASVLEVIAALGRLLDREIEVRRLPAAPGDVRMTSADTSRARDELGFRPQVGLEEGLATQIAASAELERA
jgi:UDP-glucose 4-epimerase